MKATFGGNRLRQARSQPRNADIPTHSHAHSRREGFYIPLESLSLNSLVIELSATLNDEARKVHHVGPGSGESQPLEQGGIIRPQVVVATPAAIEHVSHIPGAPGCYGSRLSRVWWWARIKVLMPMVGICLWLWRGIAGRTR